MRYPLIETKDLVKAYGDFLAVDGLNLTLEEGEVYGFLGPNGSGKSTTILMLLGLTEPTAGSVMVCGHDPTRDPLAVKRQVGYLPESVGFYSDLSGRENLRYTAALNSMERKHAEDRISEVLEMVELETGRQPVGQFSRGMRQRLGLADVLLKEPRAIILDDPTLGLDPTGIQWLLGIIEELSEKHSITVFLSSHALHEVQRVCSRVGIMSHGQIVLEGSVPELSSQNEAGGFHLTMEVTGGKEKLWDALAAIPTVRRVDHSGTSVAMESDGDVRASAAAVVVEEGAKLLEIRSENRTLEEIYLRYFQTE
jgi:ABC-2 type transport system ATP-binding protein